MERNALIIEDNKDIASLVQMHLTDIGCNADVAGSGEEGVRWFKNKAYNLVVLDLMLPGIDGLQVCQLLRRNPDYVPILMLTAKSAEIDRVLGLEIGADDYLTKPFSIPELLARMKALFRRTEALQEHAAWATVDETLHRDELTIEVGKRQITKCGAKIPLTAKEFDLLLHFARHPGRVYTRTELLNQVWGYNHEGYEHTVNSHINRLRAKIESNPAKPDYVVTVWGVGYKFADERL